MSRVTFRNQSLSICRDPPYRGGSGKGDQGWYLCHSLNCAWWRSHFIVNTNKIGYIQQQEHSRHIRTTIWHLKPLGTHAKPLDRNLSKGKFDQRSWEFNFLGYSEESKAFRLSRQNSGKIPPWKWKYREPVRSSKHWNWYFSSPPSHDGREEQTLLEQKEEGRPVVADAIFERFRRLAIVRLCPFVNTSAS